jgi:hypothetical protein
VDNPTDTPVVHETNLRQAIAEANHEGGYNTIKFSALFDTPQTIVLGDAGRLDISNSTGDLKIEGPGANLLSISGNHKSQVFYLGRGTAYLSGLTIENGYSRLDGGGVYSDGTLHLTTCTISGNRGTNNGGGVSNYGTLNLQCCTVSGNRATNGGGVFNNNGTLSLNNTIVAGNTNTSPTRSPSDVGGSTKVSGAFNLIGRGGSGGLTDGVNGNIVGVADPGLGPLGNYGGPTKTMALKPGSPAIGNGFAALGTTDQRGFPLDTPKPDIGAFQYQTNQFSRLGVGNQTGAITVGTAGFATFDVASYFLNTGSNTVTFKVSWAATPAGVTTTFSPTFVTGTNASTRHATLTIATNGSTPPGNYRFTVTGTGNGGVQHTASGTLVVNGVVATKLVFTTQPPAGVFPGRSIQVVAQITDSSGHPVNVFLEPVTITISSGVTLRGTKTVKTNLFGKAVFNDLYVLWPGTYKLTIKAKGLSSATSRPFKVSF